MTERTSTNAVSCRDPSHSESVQLPPLAHRLDRIVRMLLASIARCDEWEKNKDDNEKDLEYLLGVWNVQVSLLQRLQVEIQNLGTGASSDEACHVLSEMMEYLTLPLGVLLRQRKWMRVAAAAIEQGDASLTASVSTSAIRHNALCKVAQTAADTLRACVVGSGGGGVTSSQQERFVAVCAVSLPETTGPSFRMGDRGEACVASVLQCLDVLLLMEHQDGHGGDKAEGPRLRMTLTIFVRIVDGCQWCLGTDISKGEGTLVPAGSPGDTRAGSSSPMLQAQALTTLGCLLRASFVSGFTNRDHQWMWQQAMPGCFGTLVRFIFWQLRPSTKQVSPKVTADAVTTLARILETGTTNLSGEGTIGETRMERFSWRLQQLREAAAIQGTSTEDVIAETHRQSEDADDTTDRSRVNMIFPGPLMSLLNLLASESSPNVRMATPSLCRCLLVDTRHIWDTPSPSLELRQASLECCLILSMDKDERVSTAACATLEDYRQQLSAFVLEDEVATVIAPRILDLLREVAILVQSQRETELRARLRAISGYLNLVSSTNNLGLSLVEYTAGEDIRKILIGLFDVDFEESVQYVSGALHSMEDKSEPHKYRCRFGSDETEDMARRMLRTFGRTVGIKNATATVDALIEELYQAVVTRAESGCSMHSVSHAQWLHEWVGAVVVAHELVLGVFDDVLGSESVNQETKQCRRARKRLMSLCRAVFPLITSAPLWTLPSTVNGIDVDDDSGDRMHVGSLARLFDMSGGSTQSHRLPLASGTAPRHTAAVSASALKGNTVLVGSLMQMVGSMISLIGEASDSLLPTLLYPLCEKASSRNHSQIQNTSAFVLRKVATACGALSTADLLRLNFDYLFGPVLSVLQEHTIDGRGYPTDTASVVRAILCHSSGHANSETGGRSTRGMARSLTEETNVTYVFQTITKLVSCYDESFAVLQSGEKFLSASLELVQTLQISLDYVASTWLVRDNTGVTDSVEKPAASPDEEPWFGLLRPFRLATIEEAGDDELATLSPEEGFAKMRHERTDGKEESSNGVDVSLGEMKFLELMLRRCGFMLSLPSLKIHLASCAAIDRAFQFLEFIATHHKPKDDEANGPETAILRFIADIWPALLGRVRAMVPSMIYSRRSKVISLRAQPSQVSESATSLDVSTQMALASQLFDLLASVTEATGSFIVSRLRDDIWPVLKKVLGSFLDEWMPLHVLTNTHNTEHPSTAIVQNQKAAKFTEKDRLILSILDFVRRVFQQQDCGSNMASLIPETGTMLLPFLSDESEVGNKAMEAIRSMLRIDSDAMWRALVTTSGYQFRPPPFTRAASRPIHENTSEPSTLQRRAAELLLFVESLPEQQISRDLYDITHY